MDDRSTTPENPDDRSTPPEIQETCDPHGDLDLIAPVMTAGAELNKRFKVSSKTMSRVCRAWRKMLDPDGPFAEARMVGQGELTLPEDDAAPLAILLHIAHLNFDRVPQKLSFEELLALAVLTDKYDATRLVQPWIQSWIAGLEHLLLEPGYEEWLWIAWGFGQLESFQRLALHLAREIEVSENGFCVTPTGRILDPLAEGSCFPPEVIDTLFCRMLNKFLTHTKLESILDAREQAIRGFFDAYHSHAKTLSSEDTSTSVCGNDADEKYSGKKCDLLAFGSITSVLYRLGLGVDTVWTPDISWSVSRLYECLVDIKVYTLQHVFCPIVCGNLSMDGKMRASIKDVFEGMAYPLKDWHLRHVDRQAAKLSVVKAAGHGRKRKAES